MQDLLDSELHCVSGGDLDPGSFGDFNLTGEFSLNAGDITIVEPVIVNAPMTPAQYAEASAYALQLAQLELFGMGLVISVAGLADGLAIKSLVAGGAIAIPAVNDPILQAVANNNLTNITLMGGLRNYAVTAGRMAAAF